jgi:1-acyl-sn-glycerol-3-phosphate acyltransferase/DNA-directed RNA polymerase subunit RPC12/RpoP
MVKKPNAFLYFMLYMLIYPILKIFFRLRVERGGFVLPKGPCIVLSNHLSFMDFLLVMLTLYPRRLNAVAAQKFFLYRPLGRLLPFMGCIPKNLFDPDVRAARGILSVLKRGGSVLIYPEGRCSVGGSYMGVHASIGKLVSKMGVPVTACRVDGAYACMPFWRKGIRFGRVRVTVTNLFSAEEAGQLSVAEINNRIDDCLSGRQAPPSAKPFGTFGSRRLLEGLENILYWCPACSSEFAMGTDGCVIKCSSCGNAAVMNRRAELVPYPGSTVPATVLLWNQAQTKHELRQLHGGMAPIRVDVTVRMPGAPGQGIAPSGQGILSLDPSGWRYEGVLKGEPASLFFPLQTVPALPFDPNDNFQIYSGGSFYSFTPDGNPKACAKYATLGECMYRRFSPVMEMTAGEEAGFERTVTHV